MVIDPFSILAIGGLAGGLPALSLMRGNKKDKGTNFVSKTKNFLTATAFETVRPQDYTTIESAIKDKTAAKKEKSFSEKLLGFVKVGHIFGLAWLAATAIPYVLKKIFNFDDDSWLVKLFKVHIPFGMVGGLGSLGVATFCKNDYEGTLTNVIDDSVTRRKVYKGGKAELLKENVVDKRTYPAINAVVLPGDDIITGKDGQMYSEGQGSCRGEINSALIRAQKAGIIFNFYGVTGCGKTMTAEAIADGVLNQPWYKGKSVQIWDASSNLMDKTIVDEIGRNGFVEFLEDLIGIRLFGESIAERLERTIAHAKRHYLETGEYVVIVLNEAHDLLGMSKRNGVYNPSDPHSISRVASNIQKLVDKFRTELGSGVCVALTSNSSIDQIGTALGRRFDTNTRFGRLGKNSRKLLIQKVLNRELNKPDSEQLNKNIIRDKVQLKLDPNDYEVLSSNIGTPNLFERSYGSKQARVEKDLMPHIEKLSHYDILTGDDVDRAVVDAVLNYKSGGKEELKKLIATFLTYKESKEIQDEKWKGEITHFYGSGSSGSMGFDTASI